MIKINTEEISETAGKNLARKALAGMDAFFEKTENRGRYEEWKKKREAEKEGLCASVALAR